MPAQQLALGLLQPRRQALDNFVAGANGPALAAAHDLARGLGPQFLYLWGPPGCGRTHLLTALGGSPGVPAYRGPGGLYAVDDVQQLDPAGQARLFALLNEVRSDPAARLAAAGDAPPARLALREDVRTRLAWGLALSLQALSEQDKADALRAQAAQRGVRLSADLVPYMLAHLPRDMRTLSAALEALDAYALQQRRALTVPLLRQWLQIQDSRMPDA
jgi:DnaA family protein